MALLTDDQDINDNSLTTFYGGNGDYYVQIWYKDENGLICNKYVRIAMSGGNATPEIRLAISKLHKAMEESNKNQKP